MAGYKINIQKSIALPQINNVKRSQNFIYRPLQKQVWLLYKSNTKLLLRHKKNDLHEYEQKILALFANVMCQTLRNVSYRYHLPKMILADLIT